MSADKGLLPLLHSVLTACDVIVSFWCVLANKVQHDAPLEQNFFWTPCFCLSQSLTPKAQCGGGAVDSLSYLFKGRVFSIQKAQEFRSKLTHLLLERLCG